MALTRKALAAMGIEDNQIDQIIEMHTETVNGLKDEIDKYKEDAGKYKDAQKKVGELEKQIAKDGEENPWKVKYDALKEDFDDFKNKQTAKETKAKKTDAYKALLKEAGVAEKRIAAVLKVSGSTIDGIEFDDDGKVKDAESLTKGIKDEWGDFIATQGSTGAKTDNPPQSKGGATRTREEIMAISDRKERRQAIAENMELFGQKAITE